MHTRETVEEVLALRAKGLGARRIAAETGISPRTIGDWLAGRIPRSWSERRCTRCGAAIHQFGDMPAAYAYLLGLYLGDGYIAAHPRGVFKLRCFLDAKYPAIIEECRSAIREVMPTNPVNTTAHGSGCIEVYSYSRVWPCLFPQHGAGRKHQRRIKLEPWQRYYVDLYPTRFLRGLIYSDGCRFENTGRSWRNPRYVFTNTSADIRDLFCEACDSLGLHWTLAPKRVYVSRKDHVRRMDEFIGPKA